jgi:hypothetical protein
MELAQWGLQWLNLAVSVIIIKVVLSALPIYQCPTLLSPKFITNKISRKVRPFLWQGGKSTHKKFHLVNWNQVTSAQSYGGLGIREPKLMNIALGDKLLWRMIIGKVTWWNQAIWKKYFIGTKLKCVDFQPKVNKGSFIFKLLLSSRTLLHEKLN